MHNSPAATAVREATGEVNNDSSRDSQSASRKRGNDDLTRRSHIFYKKYRTLRARIIISKVTLDLVARAFFTRLEISSIIAV